ncbi:hypothetical protein Tco_1376810 [Tanacetum coccineum]
MEVPYSMISDAIKKKAGCKYYMAKKVKVRNLKLLINQKSNMYLQSKVEEEKENKISSIVEEAVVGKLANSISIQEPRSQRHRRIQLTIDSQTDKAVADMYNDKLKSLRKKKQPVVGEGSSVAQNKYYSSTNTDSDATLYSSSSDKSANETDDADESDILMVTSSSIDFIQTLLDETPANELTDFMSHTMYTDAQTTSVMHNPKENPELISYISGASEVPLSTHVDV